MSISGINKDTSQALKRLLRPGKSDNLDETEKFLETQVTKTDTKRNRKPE